MRAQPKVLWPPEGAGVASVRLDDLLALEALATRLSRASPGHRPEGTRRTVRLRARGMEYAESRPYQCGDDARSIDWRVTARTARTHTKLYEEEREQPVWLCVDQRQTMQFGTRNAFKGVLASHVAAILGWAALSRGDRIGGAAWTDSGLRVVPPRRGRSALNAVFGLLVKASLDALSPARPTGAAASLAHLLSATGSGARVWVFSDFMAASPRELEETCLLGRRQRMTLVQVVDPLEEDLPPVAGAWLTDAAGRLARFDSYRATPEEAPAYLVRQRLRSCAQRPGIELACARTSEEPEAVARRLLAGMDDTANPR